MEQTQSVSIDHEEIILRPTGDLTIFEAARFHADLVTLLRQEGSLQLDLTEVDRVDSSCVQLIVAATRSGRLGLRGYSPGIRGTFEQIGFAQFLPAHESYDSTTDKQDTCPMRKTNEVKSEC